MGEKKRRPADVDWVVLDENTGEGVCRRCEEVLNLPLPMDIEIFLARLEGFLLMHSKCKEAPNA